MRRVGGIVGGIVRGIVGGASVGVFVYSVPGVGVFEGVCVCVQCVYDACV